MASTHPPYLARDDSISDSINEPAFITRTVFTTSLLPLRDWGPRQLGPRLPVSRQFDSFLVLCIRERCLLFEDIYIFNFTRNNLILSIENSNLYIFISLDLFDLSFESLINRRLLYIYIYTHNMYVLYIRNKYWNFCIENVCIGILKINLCKFPRVLKK